MRSRDQIFDVFNPLITLGEIVQDVRDRDIKLGISALAGFLEDLSQPDNPNFQRARWSAISDVVRLDNDVWQDVQGIPRAPQSRKNKDTAVIVGVASAGLKECRELLGNIRAWPSAVYSYRGVDRAGLLSSGFGQYEDRDAVAMLIGRNDFKVSLGLTWVTGEGFVRVMNGRPKRHDIKVDRLYLPRGVAILDEVPVDEIPSSVPLV